MGTLVAEGQHRRKVSGIGGLSVSPNSQRLGFYFATQPDGFFTADKVITYLRDLLRHLRSNVIVVWDGGSNHKGPLMREFLAKTPRLHLISPATRRPMTRPGTAVINSGGTSAAAGKPAMISDVGSKVAKV